MKQHAEMSLFVKHVADNQHFPVFLGRHCHAYSLYGVFPSRSRHFGGVSEKKTLSRTVTRNALAVRNNEAYGQGNGRKSFATGHGNFVIGSFNTRASNGLSVWDWPVYSRPLPHRHPFSDFFWGEGASVLRLSKTDNSSSNCPSKLTDIKVRRRITRLTRTIRL